MQIKLIAAMDLDNAIGRNNQLPWYLPADLIHFKSLTTGKAIVLGRKTWESLGCKPLPNRVHVVVSKTLKEVPSGVTLVRSFEAALEVLKEFKEVFVIGGGELYKQALPLADLLYVTKVHCLVGEPDTWFPKISLQDWTYVRGVTRKADLNNEYDLSFITYSKRLVE